MMNDKELYESIVDGLRREGWSKSDAEEEAFLRVYGDKGKDQADE